MRRPWVFVEVPVRPGRLLAARGAPVGRPLALVLPGPISAPARRASAQPRPVPLLKASAKFQPVPPAAAAAAAAASEAASHGSAVVAAPGGVITAWRGSAAGGAAAAARPGAVMARPAELVAHRQLPRASPPEGGGAAVGASAGASAPRPFGRAAVRHAVPIGARPASAPARRPVRPSESEIARSTPRPKQSGRRRARGASAAAPAPQQRLRKGGPGVRSRVQCQGASLVRRTSRAPSAPGRKFAFVTVLWAPESGNPEEYIVNALSLGCSLRKTSTKHDLVLLATPDLLSYESARALSTFWDVRQQDHAEVPLKMRCAPRFRHVFTKLSVMKLTEYDKVLMLDADMLVIRNVDELFGFPAPAGFMRGTDDYRPSEIRPPETIRAIDGRVVGGINAGVVLLEPVEGEYERMFGELQSSAMRRDLKNSRGPEQDFLTLFYKSRWSGLHPKYNYQLHQILLNPWGERMRIGWDDISILHFSAELKPSSFWLSVGIPDYSQWLRTLFDAHSGKTGAVADDIDAAYDRVHRAVTVWIGAWKDAWQGLVDGLPEKMVQNRLQKCLLCGQRGHPDAQHLFFECPCVQDLARDFKSVCAKYKKDPTQFLKAAPRGALVGSALSHYGLIYHRFCMDPSEVACSRGEPAYCAGARCEPGRESALQPGPRGSEGNDAGRAGRTRPSAAASRVLPPREAKELAGTVAIMSGRFQTFPQVVGLAPPPPGAEEVALAVVQPLCAVPPVFAPVASRPQVFEDADPFPELQVELSMEGIEMAKDRGIKFFSRGCFEESVRWFSKAAWLAELTRLPFSAADEPDAALRSYLYSSRAFALLRLERWAEAEADCSKALGLNGDYVKARYCRAMTRLELGMAEGALRDVDRVLEEFPNSAEVAELRRKIQERLYRASPELRRSSEARSPERPTPGAAGAADAQGCFRRLQVAAAARSMPLGASSRAPRSRLRPRPAARRGGSPAAATYPGPVGAAFEQAAEPSSKRQRFN